jgi:hypothetical protein
MERQSCCDLFEAAIEVDEAKGVVEWAVELAKDKKLSKCAQGVAMKKVSQIVTASLKRRTTERAERSTP